MPVRMSLKPRDDTFHFFIPVPKGTYQCQTVGAADLFTTLGHCIQLVHVHLKKKNITPDVVMSPLWPIIFGHREEISIKISLKKCCIPCICRGFPSHRFNIDFGGVTPSCKLTVTCGPGWGNKEICSASLQEEMFVHACIVGLLYY